MNKSLYRFACLIILLSPILSGCKTLDNGSSGDWITTDFSLESNSQNINNSRSSDEVTQTILISAVPENYSLESNTTIPDNYYSRGLMDQANNTVSLSIPVSDPLRLVENVYQGEKSLNELTTEVPIAASLGISDSFTISEEVETVTVYIKLLTSPTVSSTVPTEASTDTSSDTSIQVTFSNTMAVETVTTNTNDTNCSGAIQVSSDRFSSCIKMSATPEASNSNRTFTVTPASNLSVIATYQIRVLNSVTDTNGNHMVSSYTTSTGFSTKLSSWVFVDGDGINKDTGQDGEYPQLTVFNSELFAIWSESDGTADLVRVAKWDGNSTWEFVDTDGLNKASLDAYRPQLTVFNSELYAIWYEENGTAKQIRVAKWDGNSTWNFVDGGGTDGINKDPSIGAFIPQLTVFNSELYAIWYEKNGTITQIRVAKWDGNYTWNFVDGGGADGINKDPGQGAYYPQLAVFDSTLYATWYESNGSAKQIRVARWDGDSTWNFVDGDGANGINKDPGLDAKEPQLAVFNSALFATWYESNGSVTQIRVARWDGDSTWNFVDGDGANGINKVTSKSGSLPQLTVFNSRLLATWTEETSSSMFQIPVAMWDGNSTWNFVDGNDATGITSQPAYLSQLTVFNSKLFAICAESNGSKVQVRVAVAE